MTKNQACQRIEKLKELINRQRYLYHVLDRPGISPEALDSLKKELWDLEEKFPSLVTVDSPTQRVGGRALEKFVKVRHAKPMLSFNDAFSEDDMADWLVRNDKLLTENQKELARVFYCEPKLDGLAIELIYEKGLFKTGSTRGSGFLGEDVTQNLKTIEAIPLSLKDQKTLTVRGEVIIRKREFAQVNQEQAKKGLALFANPRNLAAGSIRQLDPGVATARKLDANLYSLVSPLGQSTHEQEHEILHKLGFKTNNKYSQLCRGLKEVFEYRQHWLKNRARLPYEIDGIVVQINDNRIFEKLGVAGKAPRGAIAFKFPLKQATTRVEDVVFQVGRTGAVTPVAALSPVQVSGTTISRSTLHNIDEIKRLGLRIGDTAVVGRAGDVIPHILRVLKELRTGREKKIAMPRTCPVCRTTLVRPAAEVVWRCPNVKCRARSRENFYHFVSRAAFDIRGLGPQIIDRLLDESLVQDPADLFLLQEGDLLALDRFGEKSAANLVAAIRSRKKIDLARFLYSLGLRHVGEETSRDLAERFGSLEDIKGASLRDLEGVADVGPVVAKSIYEYFCDKRNSEFLKKLQKAGIQIENTKRQPQSTKLGGLTFVLTGALVAMTREAAKEKIRELGGKVVDSVSRQTGFVVAGDDPGSKVQRAKDLGVKIISEGEFEKMLK